MLVIQPDRFISRKRTSCRRCAFDHHGGKAIGISRTTGAENPRRVSVVGITWPVPDGLDDAALDAPLFSPPYVVHESRGPDPGAQAARQGNVEVAVQVAERWVLRKLRRRRFCSLGELNAEVGG
jgi:hypothetical protein